MSYSDSYKAARYRLEIRDTHLDDHLGEWPDSEWRTQSHHRSEALANAAGRRIQRMLSPGWQWRVVKHDG